MAKLIQICASENDLFGLDGDGVVYHYNFNTNGWMRLSRRRHDDGGSASADDQSTTAQPGVAGDRSRPEVEPLSREDPHEPPR
jgi:hypothetical protein